jgi:hypothetical protein
MVTKSRRLVLQKLVTNLVAQVRLPRGSPGPPETPRGAGVRDLVAAPTRTDARTGRSPLSGHSPHPAGKQQLPERASKRASGRTDARPARPPRAPPPPPPAPRTIFWEEVSEGRPGSPDSGRGGGTPAPERAFLRSPECAPAGGKGRAGRGRRVREREAQADGAPATRGSAQRRPEAPPSGSAAAVPGAAGAAPSSPASARPTEKQRERKKKRKREEVGSAQPRSGRLPLTNPWPRWRSALCGDWRARREQRKRAAAARRLRRPASGASLEPRPVGGERRVGNRGGDRARSRHRRAPAFPARERVPASPGPAPSAPMPSLGARPCARARPRLDSRAPSSRRRLSAPPPGARARPQPRACVRGSARLVLCAGLPARAPPCGPTGLPALQTGLSRKKLWDPTPKSRWNCPARTPPHTPLPIPRRNCPWCPRPGTTADA